MKNNLKKLLSLTAALIFLFSLASCGADSLKNNVPHEEYEKSESFGTSGIAGDMNGEMSDVGELNGAPDSSAVGDRKIIETVRLSVQTKDFDSLIKSIESEISASGGYIEHSSSSGNSYASRANRRADMTVRIPAASGSKFTDFVEANGNVVSRELNTEDVTLKYVDAESRLSALKAEKQALESLLEKAATTEDVLSIRDRLTNVIYEIESYTSQLKKYDNLVEYTTFELTIYEVERTTPAEEQSVWAKIGTDFSNNLSDIGNFFVNLFVFIVGALPYIILLAVIAAIVIVIVKVSVKKSRSKREKLNATRPVNAQPYPPRPQNPTMNSNDNQNGKQ